MLIGGKAMQVADRERLFDFALPAALFAQARANASKGGREREALRDNLRGLRVVTGRNPLNEVGDVQVCRAACLARADAVPRVVGEQ